MMRTRRGCNEGEEVYIPVQSNIATLCYATMMKMRRRLLVLVMALVR